MSSLISNHAARAVLTKGRPQSRLSDTAAGSNSLGITSLKRTSLHSKQPSNNFRYLPGQQSASLARLFNRSKVTNHFWKVDKLPPSAHRSLTPVPRVVNNWGIRLPLSRALGGTIFCDIQMDKARQQESLKKALTEARVTLQAQDCSAANLYENMRSHYPLLTTEQMKTFDYLTYLLELHRTKSDSKGSEQFDTAAEFKRFAAAIDRCLNPTVLEAIRKSLGHDREELVWFDGNRGVGSRPDFWGKFAIDGDKANDLTVLVGEAKSKDTTKQGESTLHDTAIEQLGKEEGKRFPENLMVPLFTGVNSSIKFGVLHRTEQGVDADSLEIEAFCVCDEPGRLAHAALCITLLIKENGAILIDIQRPTKDLRAD